MPIDDYQSFKGTQNPDRFIASCTSWDEFYERTKALSTRRAQRALCLSA